MLKEKELYEAPQTEMVLQVVESAILGVSGSTEGFGENPGSWTNP